MVSHPAMARVHFPWVELDHKRVILKAYSDGGHTSTTCGRMRVALSLTLENRESFRRRFATRWTIESCPGAARVQQRREKSGEAGFTIHAMVVATCQSVARGGEMPEHPEQGAATTLDEVLVPKNPLVRQMIAVIGEEPIQYDQLPLKHTAFVLQFGMQIIVELFARRNAAPVYR